MQTTPRDAVAESRRTIDRTDPDDLRYSLRISVWVRWFLLTAWLVQFNYRPNFADPAYIPTTLFAGSLLALNGYVHYRIRSHRTVTRRWALALSVMDGAMITAGIAISSSGFHNTFFVLYYPALAMFAVVFTSFRLSFAWVTMVAVVYAALSLVMEPGVDYGIKEEKILFTRIVVMYAVVAAVNLVSRFERTRRREAVEREGELQRERIELSQTIHDTIAQSAYMMGLGIETAIELAKAQNDEGRDELIAKLEATRAMSKSTMWELRHPIDGGTHIRGARAWPRAEVPRLHVHVDPHRACPVRQGAPAFHRHTGTAILDSPQRHDQRIQALARRQGRHCAELRWRQAPNVSIRRRDRSPRRLRRPRHGFRRMRTDAERMGGSLEAGPGESGRGTTVTCVVPYDTKRGGA